MAHHTVRKAYQDLAARINRFPQGAPPTRLLFEILEMLFSEKEAELVSLLPIKHFNAERAATLWHKSEKEAKKILDELAGRGILLDIEENGESHYVLPPPMAGFFEFSLMRVRHDIDQKVLSGLFYEYLNVEEDFIRELFATGETKLGRAFVNEPALPDDDSLHVLDYERASEVIRTARNIGIGLCYCRHKMEHLGKSCNAPMEICMTFNSVAGSLNKHGITREVDRAEALDLLQQAYEHNLVQFGDNVREKVGFICNCCGCCCEAMIAARRFSTFSPVHTTNFLLGVDERSCVGCGKCVDLCPVEAMGLVGANDPRKKTGKKARVDRDSCLGCGVCVRNCPKNNLRLTPIAGRVITPIDSAYKTVLMAIERGRFHDLLFDIKALRNHRVMGLVLGALLKLPPAKQILASEQVRSRYLEYIYSRIR